MSRTTRWVALRSPLHWWHLRHVLQLWIGVRVLVLMVLSFGQPRGAPPVSAVDLARGPAATLAAVSLTSLLAVIDRRRADAPLLFANLGYSAWWLASSTVAITLVAETLLRLVLSAA